MISLNSRYVTDRVVRVVDPDDVSRQVIVQRPVRTKSFDFTYYQWMEGDRIDVVAQSYFDDERLWYVIAEANPEILVWNDVAVGTVIRIPNG
jgi:hypothetical protein